MAMRRSLFYTPIRDGGMSRGDQLLAFGRPRSLISTVPGIKLYIKKENSFGYRFAFGEGLACFIGSGFYLLLCIQLHVRQYHTVSTLTRFVLLSYPGCCINVGQTSAS